MVMEQGSGDERQGPGGQEEQVGGQRLVDPRVLFESQREFGRGFVPEWIRRVYRELSFEKKTSPRGNHGKNVTASGNDALKGG